MTDARPWFAVNARQLLASRQRGLLPSGPVGIALLDVHVPGGATLSVRDDMPLDRLDWRMLVNLDVWVWASAAVPIGTISLVLDRIARARPKRLVLRFLNGAQTHDVDLGDGCHIDAPGLAQIHRFTWCPINLSGSSIGARLRRVLLQINRPMAEL